MDDAWRPAPGLVALIEPDGDAHACLTGTVVDDGTPGHVVIDLGASPRLPAPDWDVVASFFSPDALFRTHATAHAHADSALLELDVHDVLTVQRRSAPRHLAELDVIMSSLDGPGELLSTKGHTVDIAVGGCRIVCDRPLPPGVDPTVTIRLPDGGAVVALARVLERRRDGDHHEYRLVFADIDEADALRLAALDG